MRTRFVVSLRKVIGVNLFYSVFNSAFQLSACGARQMTKEWGELNAN
jgi:hypothetical protein